MLITGLHKGRSASSRAGGTWIPPGRRAHACRAGVCVFRASLQSLSYLFDHVMPLREEGRGVRGNSWVLLVGEVTAGGTRWTERERVVKSTLSTLFFTYLCSRRGQEVWSVQSRLTRTLPFPHVHDCNKQANNPNNEWMCLRRANGMLPCLFPTWALWFCRRRASDRHRNRSGLARWS